MTSTLQWMSIYTALQLQALKCKHIFQYRHRKQVSASKSNQVLVQKLTLLWAWLSASLWCPRRIFLSISPISDCKHFKNSSSYPIFMYRELALYLQKHTKQATSSDNTREKLLSPFHGNNQKCTTRPDVLQNECTDMAERNWLKQLKSITLHSNTKQWPYQTKYRDILVTNTKTKINPIRLTKIKNKETQTVWKTKI